MSLTRSQEDALKITITHEISLPETAGELGPEAADRLRRIVEAAAEAAMSSAIADLALIGSGVTRNGATIASSCDPDRELEDHQIQERAAADIASLSGSESLMDGLAELLDDESIEGLLAAAERVRRSRDQDPRP